jgi:hypothetical protein
MVRRWRLLPEHVDAGPGEGAIAQRFHERSLVDYPAAGGLHEH